MNNGNRFETLVEEKIQPWLHERITSGKTVTPDGTHLQYYYAIHPEAKAAVTFVHGHCEFFGKYHEMLYRFYEEGYSVFFVELRGFGHSDRLVKQMDYVYINSYNQYVEDVITFQEMIVKPMTKNLKHYLFGHSMGGCVSALVLEDYPSLFDAAILSSPMLEINFRGVSNPKIQFLRVYSTLKKLDKELIPGTKGWENRYEFEKSSALSKARYDYQFEQRQKDSHYQTWGTTNGWVKASLRAIKKVQKNVGQIHVSILLLQAGKDTMVNNHGQDVFEQNSPTTRIVVFKDSKHEIYNGTEEIVERFYERIFSFLDKQANKKADQEKEHTKDNEELAETN
ncbi:MAG: alpha/beta fold hydrolase [Solobacterium sp.]|nr:alpha/beta fold hydrolase [Solobacterium sp.]